MGQIQDKEIFRPLEENGFRFECHTKIACFNQCCARLRLILTPYDILRMKNRLRLSSRAFLDQYTDTVLETRTRFPMVKLKMRDNEKGACPFVTEQGCAIYADRPGACRLYPLGRASTVIRGEKHAREKFFVVQEEHCLGFREAKRWRLDEWLRHEGMDEYHEMNDPWSEIITSPDSMGQGDQSRKFQMFFMASYNLDSFRKFIFESKFLQRFQVPSDLTEKMARDDTVLMRFGFKWLKFSLFGERTIELRPQAESY